MTHVTPGTANSLMEHGFPQPEIEFGQFWYDIDGLRAVVTSPISGGDNSEDLVFAPTATDILPLLGGDYRLSFLNGFFFLEKEGCFGGSVSKCTNPAELLAIEWLKLNPK